MKFINTFSKLLAIASVVIISSCGGEEKPAAPKYNFERADSLPTGYLQELGIIKTNIEVTAQLYQDLGAAGYSFSESILLSAGKSFSGSSKQAMGIGAIGSDMVYAGAYAQTQSAMSRMEGLLKTAGDLGIAEAFDQELMEKMASDDTTINKSVLLTKAYLNAKDQLFSDERAQYATFMVIGGWIEGLHISCQMTKDELSDQNIRLGVWSVCNAYTNVMQMTDVFSDNADMQKITEELKTIKEPLNKILKNSKKFSSDDVKALAEAVSEIRGKLY
ncbi:MAG: hypothetical protein WEC59_12065 [Salibacteraceae bacterium]